VTSLMTYVCIPKSFPQPFNKQYRLVREGEGLQGGGGEGTMHKSNIGIRQPCTILDCDTANVVITHNINKLAGLPIQTLKGS
jgi:hypothetical protein